MAMIARLFGLLILFALQFCTPVFGQLRQCPDPLPDQPFVPCLNVDKYLVWQNGSGEDATTLDIDMMSLDHRAHERLGPDTTEWAEVLGLLYNAAAVNSLNGNVKEARMIYERAEQTYLTALEAKNRIQYLLGLMLGILACTFVAGFLFLIARCLAQPFVDPKLLPLLCLFAGIGSLTSVLTRLDQINLKFETSRELLMISGGARPIVAIFFALIVYLILELRVIDVKFGSPTASNANSIFLISAFLCGFSERFAQDILSKVAAGVSGINPT